MAQDPVSTNEYFPREGVSTLLQRSCHDCNRRKVRCSKSWPCDNCVRLGVECAFPPPGRKPRKITKRSSNKDQLISRLGLLEDRIKNLGSKNLGEQTSPDFPPERQNDDDGPHDSRTMRSGLAMHSPGNGILDHPREAESNEIEISKEPVSSKATSGALEDQFGRLVVDRNSGTSRYVNHQFLTELADQVYFTPTLHRYRKERTNH